MSRRRRWLFVVLALLIGSVLALVAIEAAFRLLWKMPQAFAEFEQAGLYRQEAGGRIGLQPGYRGTLLVGGLRTQVVVNSLGMRGEEVGVRQPAERRVLVVGDSLVFGYGVEASEALPARLQQVLGKGTRPVVVGNAGVPGCGSRDAALALQAFDGPFAADALVVCGFLGNDAVDDLRVDRLVFAGQKFDGPMARLVKNSVRMQLAVRFRAVLWLESWIFTNHPSWSPLLQQAPSVEELASLRGLPGDYPLFAPSSAGLFLDAEDLGTVWATDAPPVIPRTLAILRSSLQRAKEIAGARPLLFVILPTRFQVQEPLRVEKLRQLGFDPAKFPRGTAQRRWGEIASQLGIPVFDATIPLAAAGDVDTLFVDQGHLSVRGNEVVAEWLAPEIASRLP